MNRLSPLVVGLLVVAGLPPASGATGGPTTSGGSAGMASVTNSSTQDNIVGSSSDSSENCSVVTGNETDPAPPDPGEREIGDVTAQPWFEDATIAANATGNGTYAGTITIDRSKLIDSITLTLTLVSWRGSRIENQTVTISPTGPNASPTRTVEYRPGGAPSYLELQVNGQYVTDRLYSSAETLKGVVDTNLSVTEQSAGTVTGTVSVTFDRGRLSRPVELWVGLETRNGSPKRRWSKITPVPPNSSDSTRLVTKTVRGEFATPGHLVASAQVQGPRRPVDIWHDPSPSTSPGYRDPPGTPIPDVGTLDWNGTRNGLEPSTIAVLFARDDEGGYINQSSFQQTYGKERPPVMETANGSDWPYSQPPGTARTWTRNDFAELEAGDRETSVAPASTETTDGTYIKDAHATIFAAQPSTLLHRSPGNSQLYIAPNGSLWGLADYRAVAPATAIPSDPDPGDRRRLGCVAGTDIEVRFRQDGRITNRTGDQTPRFNYSFEGSGMTDRRLTLEAEISATVKARTDVYRCRNETDGPDDANESQCFWEAGPVRNDTETVTVEETLSATVYRLRARVTNATYPSGEEGVAVYYSGPWSSVSLTADEQSDVRGVWRYFTGHRREWGVLARYQTTGEDDYYHSPALPVQVHAYPSRIGPRPDDPSTDIIDTWGNTRRSPSGFGRTIGLEPVEPRYTATWGMAVRAPTVDPSAVTVQGIVNGTNSSVQSDRRQQQSIRRANLSMAIIATNESGAVVEVTLRDAETGSPIVLADPPSGSPFRPVDTGESRDGSIVVDGKQVETDESGTARVFVTDPGHIEARYEPDLWIDADPAYASDGASVQWTPQNSIWYWFELALDLFLLVVLPVGIVWYLGVQLGKMLGYERQ